ncbi:hypothetical protein SBA4_860016 [Candidatus Sulfopaludibacter sp. SbA4]|nr:hypothetical protein SBA4_860016 [Candidatus Sulfopaludibacter sp. SbA4]
MDINDAEHSDEGQGANGFEIPDDVQQRFETAQFKADVEKLRKDLRDAIGETPIGFELLGLFREFAVALALLAERANPPASFRHPDRHLAFREAWLPTWVTHETLRAWSDYAPKELSQKLSNDWKFRRKFWIKLDNSIRTALRRGNLTASVDATAKKGAALESLQTGGTGYGTSPKVENAPSIQEKPQARRGYRAEVRRWMESEELLTIPDAAKRLGVGPDTLKSIMSNKGKKRYSDDTLSAVLKKIGHREPGA